MLKLQGNFTTTKKTSDSKCFFSHATVPYDLNEGGSVYGARILEWADNLSGLVSIKHRRGSVTTASFDQFNFVNPIELGDFIFGEAFISGTGDASMEIFIKFVGEKSVTGERYLAAFGFITYAAKKLKPGEKVPKIEGVTEEETSIIQGYEERKKIIKEKIERNKKLTQIIKL